MRTGFPDYFESHKTEPGQHFDTTCLVFLDLLSPNVSKLCNQDWCVRVQEVVSDLKGFFYEYLRQDSHLRSVPGASVSTGE